MHAPGKDPSTQGYVRTHESAPWRRLEIAGVQATRLPGCVIWVKSPDGQPLCDTGTHIILILITSRGCLLHKWTPASWEAASEEEKHVFTGGRASQMELTQVTKASVFFLAQKDRCGNSGPGELARQCQAGKNWSSPRCPGLVWKGWPAAREEVEKQASLPGSCLSGYASSRPGYGGGQRAPVG